VCVYTRKSNKIINLGSKLGSHNIKEGCLSSILGVAHTRTGSKPRKLSHFQPLHNQNELRTLEKQKATKTSSYMNFMHEMMRETLAEHWVGKELEVFEGSLVVVGILEEARAAWLAMAATKVK
jgi:hypothetical protein